MRKYLVPVFSALVVSAGSAVAADLPGRSDAPAPAPYAAPAPVSTWTGVYVGMNAGGAWKSSSTITPSANFVPALAVPGTKSRFGATAGLTLGYNYQINNIVLGVEGDLNVLAMRSKRGYSAAGVVLPAGAAAGAGPYNMAVSSSKGSNFLGTARVRAGYAFDSVLLYATGGLAFRNAPRNQSIAFFNPGLAANYTNAGSSAKSVGYALGAGMEYAIDKNWSVKGEYMYAGFGSKKTVLVDNVNAPGFSFLSKGGDSVNLFRVGLNYRFGM